MITTKEDNYKKIKLVAEKLDCFLDRVVFLGGAVVGLLLTDAAAPDVRHTIDIDVIIGVNSKREYDKLIPFFNDLGFKQCIEDDIICRWRIEDVIVDIMAPVKKILGFTNRWYPLAMKTALKYKISENLSINLINPSCFIATKIQAFESRGGNDFVMSKDLNDIINIVDGRPEIIEEIKNSDVELQGYLSRKIKKLLQNEYFLDAIPGFLNSDMESQSRSTIIINRLKKII